MFVYLSAPGAIRSLSCSRIFLIVGYADETVPQKDSAKAQSLAFSMTTIGSVLASLIGGSMFKTAGVRPTMLTATAFAAVGAAIALAATYMKKKAE